MGSGTRGLAGASSPNATPERLKDRTGRFVLAGCASDAVSYEATHDAKGLGEIQRPVIAPLSATLWRGEQEVATLTVVGSTSDVPTLAAGVEETARDRVPR